MINLLPSEQKTEIRAARANVLLFRYVILLLGTMVLLGLAMGATYLVMNMSKMTAERTITDNGERVKNYADTQKQAAELRSNLATAKTILSKEVVYSKVIQNIAATLPKGVVLESLQLDSKTFGTQTTLNAKAKTYADALALKNACESSPLFSDVHFQAITDTTDETDTAYPIGVQIDVKINKEAIQQ